MNRVPVGMKLTLNISRNIKPNSKRVQNVAISLFNTAAQTAKFIPSLLLKRYEDFNRKVADSKFSKFSILSKVT